MPSLTDVSSEWLRLHGPNKVEGASGWICLDNSGNAYNKAVSVVRLDPSTPHTRFVSLAWPTGKRPSAQCTIPSGD